MVDCGRWRWVGGEVELTGCLNHDSGGGGVDSGVRREERGKGGIAEG